jgi:hypothetical protein
MTVELAKIIQINIDQVVEVCSVHKGKSWGVIAKELGVKPGSLEFHGLSKNKGKNTGKYNKGKGESIRKKVNR